MAIFRFEFIWLTLIGKFYLFLRNSGGDDYAMEMRLSINEFANTYGCIVIALSLTVTNTLAFSRCDKFGQASNLAGSAMYSSGIAGNIASATIGRFFSR